MVIRRSALIWGPAFILVGALNVILDPAAERPGANQGGQGSWGAAPVAASAGPRGPTFSPTPTTHPAARLRATVVGVEGVVQVRHRKDGPWQRCEVGMVLEQEAEFRTGPRSAVRFTVGPDRTITLDRSGVISLLRAVNEPPPATPEGLEFKPGRIEYHYDIQPGGPAGPIATARASASPTHSFPAIY